MSTDHSLNFRLQGIPNEYQTRADVRELVKKVLSIESCASVSVHSLAINPVEQHSKVATLSFHTLPACLPKCSRNEWVFNLPEGDGLGCGRGKSLRFDTHFSGFTPLQHTKNDNCFVDIIAISGLGGHAFGSFKERGGPFMWLRDALPLDVPGARILIYGYDTQLIWSSSFQNLTDLGKALQIDMKGVRQLYQSRPIIFIGHSLGGLVIKEAIIKLKEDQDEEDVLLLNSISGFLFFGVPHQGMAIESLIPLVKDYPNRSLLESLNKNSALLQRLEREFSNTFSAKHVRIISFYETRKSPTAVKKEDGKWELVGPPEILVDVASATCSTKSQHPINRNHSELVKFYSEYDEIYRRVHTALRPLVNRLQSQSVTVNAEVGGSSSKPLSEDNLKCLRSLSFRAQDYRYHDIYLARNTCEWILEDSEYRSWMNEQRGLFWIKGNPGAGKSVLMKFAVNMMNQRNSGELVASFFIHGRGIDLQKTPLGVYRALLSSMLKHFPEYLSKLTERFKDQEARFGTFEEKRWDWTENELQEFLSELLTYGTRSRPVCIFVDALDECGEHYAKCLLEYFKTLISDVESEGARVKICFSSRHYPILGLNTIPMVSVEERNSKDIRLVIRERLKQIEPKSRRQEIEKEILLKAQGGFQWVVLIIAIVIDGIATGIKTDKLREKIKATPEALDELYTDILSGATAAEHYQMFKVFQWVLYAGRPLSAQELREALATDKDMTHTTISELRSHDSWSDTIAQFEVYIRYISRGLVEFQTREIWEQYEPDGEDADREVQFVHQSVADYIPGKFLNLIQFEHASQSLIGAGHFAISRSCLKYLTLAEVLEGAQLSRGTLSARFPLLPYVVQYVFHHIRNVEQEGIAQPDLLSLIRWSGHSEALKAIASVWKVMDPENAHTPMGWPFIGATPLHVLISFGSKSAFDTFLDNNDAEVDGKDSDGNTPLLLALRESHQDIALALLDRSIKWQALDQNLSQDKIVINQRNHFVDVNARNCDDETPLDVALTVKADEAIIKLIEAGSNLEFYGRQTALVSYAIRNRNKILLMKLVEKDVKLEGAVHFAVRERAYGDNGNILEEMVSELLKAGANTSKLLEVEYEDNNGNEDEYEDEGAEGGGGDAEEDEDEDADEQEAIAIAARSGQTFMVQLLLEANVHIDLKDGKYGLTPLSWAARNGHGAVVKLLMDTNKVDINSKDNIDRTPLSWAVANGHKAAVQLLLENGADIESKDQNDNTALLLAVVNGHEAVVQQLLEKGADIESKDQNDDTALLLAVYNGHKAVIQQLLEMGADLESKDFLNGQTALLWAARNGHEAVVRQLLEKGADLESKNEINDTALSLAAYNGHEAVVQQLLEKGADLESKDYHNQTALLWAARNGHEAVVRQLLEKGADLESKDHNNNTALLWAARNGHEAVVQQLLEKGADIESKNEANDTALLLAAYNGHEAVVQQLLEKGADIKSKDQNNNTALLLAVVNGHEAIVQQLLENGADIESKDQNNDTALLLAAEDGHQAVVQQLLGKGADIESKNENNDTALSLAAYNGHEAVVQQLLEKGADIESKNEANDTALLLAAYNGHEAVVQQLLEKGADIESKNEANDTALLLAAYNGHEAVVQQLLEKGADIKSKDQNDNTALLWAAQNGHEAVVRQLLEKGADIESKDRNNNTALLLAVYNGHEAVIQQLLEKGADIEYKDHLYYQTALLRAAQNGCEAVVQQLLEKGADIESKDRDNDTALLLAAVNGHEAVVRQLLEKGADIKSKNKNNDTALLLAAYNGHKAVVQQLLEKGADIMSMDQNDQTALLLAAQNGHKAVAQLLLENGSDIESKSDYN